MKWISLTNNGTVTLHCVTLIIMQLCLLLMKHIIRFMVIIVAIIIAIYLSLLLLLVLMVSHIVSEVHILSSTYSIEIMSMPFMLVCFCFVLYLVLV